MVYALRFLNNAKAPSPSNTAVMMQKSYFGFVHPRWRMVLTMSYMISRELGYVRNGHLGKWLTQAEISPGVNGREIHNYMMGSDFLGSVCCWINDCYD